jgi:hypothetical protein
LAPSFLVLSLTNEYHFDMQVLQYYSLFTRPLGFVDSAACFAPRYAIVCLDDGCIRRCFEVGFPFCVRFPDRSLAASDFLANDYREITALKWTIARDVLRFSSIFFLFDADVLVMLNPLRHLAEHNMSLDSYDFLHQAEGGDGCTAAVNSGQMLFRAGASTTAFVDTMVSYKSKMISDGKLDQAYAPDAFNVLREKGITLRTCSFPKSCVAGHCGSAHESNTLESVCTYHAHCMTVRALAAHHSFRVCPSP